MKKKHFCLLTLVLGWMFTLCLVSCAVHDSDDDDQTYKTREYIIGIGKWYTDRVKKSDGTWDVDTRTYGRDIRLEFFDRKGGSNERKVEIREYVKRTDSDKVDEIDHVGTYTVNGKTVVCTVDGNQFLRIVITLMEANELGGSFTFVKDNQTFEMVMTRSF